MYINRRKISFVALLFRPRFGQKNSMEKHFAAKMATYCGHFVRRKYLYCSLKTKDYVYISRSLSLDFKILSFLDFFREIIKRSDDRGI